MKPGYADIVSYLGQPLKQIGYESIWQCPLCRDSGKDNLKYNSKKEVLTCFADNSHSHIIYSEIARSAGLKPDKKQFEQKHINKPSSSSTPLKNDSRALSIDFEYIVKCADELSKDEKSKTFLERKRGLRGETLQLGLGIDKKNKRWVFPAFSFESELVGAEYRPPDLSKNGLKKATGTKSDLCLVNNTSEPNKKLIITEGFVDAYTFWQYFFEKNEHFFYEIATPSNGVGTIAGLLNKIKPAEYSNIIFYLDNDKAGQSSLANIHKLAKFNYSYKFNDCSCCKDFNEYYLRHLLV